MTLSLTHWLTHSQYFYFWRTKSDPRDLWPLRPGEFSDFRRIFRFSENFQNFGEFSDFWRIFWFLEDFQIFGRFSDFWKIFWFLEDFLIFGRFSGFWTIPRHLRHCLQFWQLRTWIHDNFCCLTINCDTEQHSQFLRCFNHIARFASSVHLSQIWSNYNPALVV